MASPPGTFVLADALRQQFEMQKQMMMQQLQAQQDQMNQQLKMQEQFMQRQLMLLEKHLVEKATTTSSEAIGTESCIVCLDEVAASSNKKEVAEKKSTLDDMIKDDNSYQNKKKLWIKCSGLRTVENWVTNYRNHPAGWGALLMIHGIPEITTRLRTKVQNFAVFSGLFLAGSIKATTSRLPVCSSDTTECHIRHRIFAYAMVASIVAHILCIALAMAFHNALNEAARDSDVFRMFARGKGFRATLKCERAFRAGAFACLVGVITVLHETMGWEIVALSVVLGITTYVIYVRTAGPLFRTASIVHYWREELGGKPDSDDPYNLKLAVESFKKLVAVDKADDWGECVSHQLQTEAPPPMKKCKSLMGQMLGFC